ncbi:MAG: DUF368 domain-containing protein [Proteobacteria bacterium]|nr:DUF368 domain-containing protein [Pseudomonadota bacterium]
MNIIRDLLHGAIIGVANIIPGVSGGTMALVLGFYERLISAIHHISPSTIKACVGILRFNSRSFEELQAELKKIDAFFLLKIAVGAMVAIVALANLMTYLLESWHDPTYGFFFGLVLISAAAPFKLIKRKSVSVLIAGLVALGVVVGVSNAVSGDALIEKAQVKYEMKASQESTSTADTASQPKPRTLDAVRLLFLFLMGAVAISAMILPGVSGSFLLLLMGGYFEILKAITDRDIPVLLVFGLGCLIGIVVFTRFLNFLLERWHDQTMGALLGLVIGSLWAIWPFKTSAVVGGETIYLSNRWPDLLGSMELYTLLAALIGMVIVSFLLWMEGRTQETSEETTAI